MALRFVPEEIPSRGLVVQYPAPRERVRAWMRRPFANRGAALGLERRRPLEEAEKRLMLGVLIRDDHDLKERGVAMFEQLGPGIVIPHLILATIGSRTASAFALAMLAARETGAKMICYVVSGLNEPMLTLLRTVGLGTTMEPMAQLNRGMVGPWYTGKFLL